MNKTITNSVLRVAFFTSFIDGQQLLSDFLALQKQKENFEIVGIATDNPFEPYSNAKRRFWNGFTDEEKLYYMKLIRDIANKADIPLYDGRIKHLLDGNGLIKKASPFPELFKEIWKPDVVYMTVFGQKISQELFDFPVYGFYNVHGTSINELSEWPRYPGGDVLERILEANRTYITMVLHKVNENWDNGTAVSMSDKIPIIKDSAGHLHPQNYTDMAIFGNKLIQEHFLSVCSNSQNS